MKGKWLLLTFGAGLPNWRAAARRLARQAHESGWFHEVLAYDEKSLRSDFPDFARTHIRVLNSRVRGFGWWIWKPFLISKALQMGASLGLDGVIYLDAGFELNPDHERSQSRLSGYFSRAKDQGGVFAMHLTGHSELAWSRSIVMDRFSLGPAARLAPQVQATPVLSCDDEAAGFVNGWLEACIENDYALVRDAPQDEVNDQTFREHRHDQSIFSCMLKARGIPTIPDETYWAPDWSKSGSNYPLWAARNRTRISVLDQSLSGRATRFAEKAYSRVYRESRLGFAKPQGGS